jgi:hypothetical protein
LRSGGWNWQTYYGGHSSFNPQITVMLDQQMQQFNLGVEFLLAGVDDSGGHIYSVQNPGQPEYLHDVIGYAAIGSGAIHAVQSMIGFGHSVNTDYQETVFRVYASKRRSEVATPTGVGDAGSLNRRPTPSTCFAGQWERTTS